MWSFPYCVKNKVSSLGLLQKPQMGWNPVLLFQIRASVHRSTSPWVAPFAKRERTQQGHLHLASGLASPCVTSALPPSATGASYSQPAGLSWGRPSHLFLSDVELLQLEGVDGKYWRPGPPGEIPIVSDWVVGDGKPCDLVCTSQSKNFLSCWACG